MNASWWGSLSKYEQAVITACCMEEHAAQYSEVQANNGAYLARLVNDHGVQLKEFSEDVYEAFSEASAAVYEETRQHSPLAAEVHDAFQKALREVGGFKRLRCLQQPAKRSSGYLIQSDTLQKARAVAAPFSALSGFERLTIQRFAIPPTRSFQRPSTAVAEVRQPKVWWPQFT